jgi:predicted Zn-dependent protease
VTRSQILITVVGILAVVLLFYLPKVVVENDEALINGEEVHSSESKTNTESMSSIRSLKDSLSISTDTKKSTIFADSLAETYRKLNRFDSAAYLYEALMDEDPDERLKKKAADAYFEAYTFSVEDEKR